jgi:hypothetical protein
MAIVLLNDRQSMFWTMTEDLLASLQWFNPSKQDVAAYAMYFDVNNFAFCTQSVFVAFL